MYGKDKHTKPYFFNKEVFLELHITREIASCGVRRVDITGGEPLMRKDFEEIVRELSNYGIDIGTLFTYPSERRSRKNISPRLFLGVVEYRPSEL